MSHKHTLRSRCRLTTGPPDGAASAIIFVCYDYRGGFSAAKANICHLQFCEEDARDLSVEKAEPAECQHRTTDTVTVCPFPFKSQRLSNRAFYLLDRHQSAR